ncbi:hypothetical protein NM688_g7725 [Phlebia brevispora]|uniref:Uncharacterized protein n=1 Tax=Phlebia brevispora TaxID=194682 RepID=A0ACC1S237_9APHY|nr:hypothetical protein NM688_g7725 [Phlebia brevispora]
MHKARKENDELKKAQNTQATPVQNDKTAEDTQAQEATKAAGKKRSLEGQPSKPEEPPAKKAKKAVINDVLPDDIWDRLLHLGKEFCASELMWLTGNAWDLMLSVCPDDGAAADTQSEEDTPEEDEREEPTPREMLIENIPVLVATFFAEKAKGLAPWMIEKEARDRFEKAMKDIRSNAVSTIATKHAKIFNITSTDFESKSTRSKLAEVQALLKNDQFLYDPKKSTVIDGQFRHPCILMALHIVLWGANSLKEEDARTKTKKTNGFLWSLDKTTDGLLAFITTCIYFVLKSEGIFTELTTGGTDYFDFYVDRLFQLSRMQNQFPNKYKKLMYFYDSKLFKIKTAEQKKKTLNENDKTLLHEEDTLEDDPEFVPGDDDD